MERSSGGRSAVQSVAGVLLGLGANLVAWLIAAAVARAANPTGEFAVLAAFLGGVLLGSIVVVVAALVVGVLLLRRGRRALGISLMVSAPLPILALFGVAVSSG